MPASAQQHLAAPQAAQTIAGLRDDLHAGREEAVAQVTVLATGGQAPDVVLALALHAQERDGGALHAWALALLRAGNTRPLADVLARLVLGGDLQQSAAQRFNAATQVAAPPPYAPYTHAATLGYWAGVLQAALATAAPDENGRGALIAPLLADAGRLADATAFGRHWHENNLHMGRQLPADTRLLSAMRPVLIKGMRPNGEPNLETADESKPFSAFMGVAKQVREGLERRGG